MFKNTIKDEYDELRCTQNEFQYVHKAHCQNSQFQDKQSLQNNPKLESSKCGCLTLWRTIFILKNMFGSLRLFFKYPQHDRI